MAGNNNPKDKNKYKRLCQLVKGIIDQWDPVGLLPICPPDEYDMEIESIVAIVARDIDMDTLASEIQAVFLEAFGADAFNKDINECLVIAEKLKQQYISHLA